MLLLFSSPFGLWPTTAQRPTHSPGGLSSERYKTERRASLVCFLPGDSLQISGKAHISLHRLHEAQQVRPVGKAVNPQDTRITPGIYTGVAQWRAPDSKSGGWGNRAFHPCQGATSPELFSTHFSQRPTCCNRWDICRSRPHEGGGGTI